MQAPRSPSLRAHGKGLKFTITDGTPLGCPPAAGISAETLKRTEKAHTQEAKEAGSQRGSRACFVVSLLGGLQATPSLP